MEFLIFIAVFPGIFLIRQIYKLDKIEKEPTSLIVKLCIFGAISTIPAIIIESIAAYGIGYAFESGTVLEMIIDNFLGVALVEEVCKYFFLKTGSWKHPAFNYQFDAIVYSVCVSLGFAILENIMYVVDSGLAVGLLRAVTSIPGHCVFAIFMGHYYGKAKVFAAMGDKRNSKRMLRKAVVIPTLIHGFYDFCCSGSDVLFIVFIIFIIVLYVFAFKRVKVYANEDAPI